MRSNCQLGMFFGCITLIAAINGSAWSDEPARWYVDVNGNDESDGSQLQPFATLQRAQAEVRNWLTNDGQGNVEVLIGGGIYELKETLEFSSLDSAPPGSVITFAPLPHAAVTISGGRRLTDWQPVGELWQVEVDTTELHRQLCIDDQPAIRCREPNRGFFRVTATGPDHRTRLSFDAAEWSAPSFNPGMELVLLHDWCASRVGVSAVDTAGHEIVLAEPIGASHDFFRIDGFEPHPRFWLENARDFVDEPLEWFHDRSAGKIVLKLPAGDTPDQHQITVSRLASLIRIKGEPDKPVRGIRFRGLDFKHTTCSIPPGGCAEIQASFFERRNSAVPTDRVSDPNAETGNARLSAAIEMEFANDCALEQCTIRNLGGGGIYLDRQCHANRIEACKLSEIGGSGIMIGETSTQTGPDGKQLNSSRNLVAGNRISRCGTTVYGAVGIWVGIARETQILNNEIFDLPYTGISVGWRWDATSTGCEANQITSNHIHHVMNLLSDGGGIYTLGRQPATVLSSNRIHDVPINAGRAESNGIFMDEGSSQIEVSENAIFNIARSPIRFHKALDNVVSRNRLSTASGVSPFTYNATDPARITLVDNDIREGTPDSPK